MNLAAIHRRAMDVFTNDAMSLGRGPRNVARHLRVMMRNPLGSKTEWRRIGIAGLNLKLRPVAGTVIEPRRSTGLKPASAQPELFQRLAEKDRSRFAGPSCRVLLF